jgi:two-component system OmpR family sensor kinase
MEISLRVFPMLNLIPKLGDLLPPLTECSDESRNHSLCNGEVKKSCVDLSQMPAMNCERGFAELHRQGAITGEEKTKELVGRIENESKRMSALVEDLLTLARLDQARPIVHEAVDMKKLIDEVTQAVRASNPSANITVILPDDEVFVLGDSLKVHQAILNLAVNAAIHTPAGTPITITLLSGDGQVQVKVSDLGAGLTPEQQTRVFERFYRVDQSRTRSGTEGSGLGLSIVQAIMDAHHGSVEIQSELGRGTTFTLVFPVNES